MGVCSKGTWLICLHKFLEAMYNKVFTQITHIKHRLKENKD